jgi:hypothetical protein
MMESKKISPPLNLLPVGEEIKRRGKGKIT